MAKPTELNEVKHRSANCINQYEMFKNQQCCDVTLTITDPESCEETSIECHKLALIAASQYFRDVLLAGDDSSSVNLIDLKKGKFEVVREALSFLYYGKCKVSSNNIVELLRYSITWKLNILEQLLADLFSKYLTIKNVVDAYEFALQEDRQYLAQQASRFLRNNFNDVLTTDQFNKLSFNSLCSILKEDEIRTDSEDTIMKAALIWLENNDLGKLETHELWDVVRFKNLTIKFLIKVLLHHPLMQEEPQSRLVKEAVTCLCDGDEMATSRKQPRYWGVKPTYDRLVKVTGDKKICVYNDNKKEWEHVGKVPDWVDRYTHCCVTRENLVLLGTLEKGIAGKCAILYLNSFMITATLPDCNNEFELRGIAQIGKEIFAIGGRAGIDNGKLSDRVYKLNIERSTNRWESIECLPKAVMFPLVFAYKKSVFVIGGFDVEANKTNVNQMYDIERDQWLIRSPAPAGCYSFQNGGFIHNNKIHIFTEEQHMTYAIDTDSWSFTRYGNVGYHIQPVLHGDEILACVRPTKMGSGNPSEFVCKKYDEASNKWYDVDIDVTDCMIHYNFFSFKI